MKRYYSEIKQSILEATGIIALALLCVWIIASMIPHGGYVAMGLAEPATAIVDRLSPEEKIDAIVALKTDELSRKHLFTNLNAEAIERLEKEVRVNFNESSARWMSITSDDFVFDAAYEDRIKAETRWGAIKLIAIAAAVFFATYLFLLIPVNNTKTIGGIIYNGISALVSMVSEAFLYLAVVLEFIYPAFFVGAGIYVVYKHVWPALDAKLLAHPDTPNFILFLIFVSLFALSVTCLIEFSKKKRHRGEKQQ